MEIFLRDWNESFIAGKTLFRLEKTNVEGWDLMI